MRVLLFYQHRRVFKYHAGQSLHVLRVPVGFQHAPGLFGDGHGVFPGCREVIDIGILFLFPADEEGHVFPAVPHSRQQGAKQRGNHRRQGKAGPEARGRFHQPYRQKHHAQRADQFLAGADGKRHLLFAHQGIVAEKERQHRLSEERRPHEAHGFDALGISGVPLLYAEDIGEERGKDNGQDGKPEAHEHQIAQNDLHQEPYGLVILFAEQGADDGAHRHGQRQEEDGGRHHFFRHRKGYHG